jgi:hypothetical protein
MHWLEVSKPSQTSIATPLPLVLAVIEHLRSTNHRSWQPSLRTPAPHEAHLDFITPWLLPLYLALVSPIR